MQYFINLACLFTIISTPSLAWINLANDTDAKLGYTVDLIFKENKAETGRIEIHGFLPAKMMKTLNNATNPSRKGFLAKSKNSLEKDAKDFIKKADNHEIEIKVSYHHATYFSETKACPSMTIDSKGMLENVTTHYFIAQSPSGACKLQEDAQAEHILSKLKWLRSQG